jgi:hypothetical protein
VNWLNAFRLLSRLLSTGLKTAKGAHKLLAICPGQELCAARDSNPEPAD